LDDVSLVSSVQAEIFRLMSGRWSRGTPRSIAGSAYYFMAHKIMTQDSLGMGDIIKTNGNFSCSHHLSPAHPHCIKHKPEDLDEKSQYSRKQCHGISMQ
jgi:hypothetical protein